MRLRQKEKQLLAAVLAGDFKAIEKSIETKPNLNVMDENKTPVLHLVIQATNLTLEETCNLIELLIAGGANVASVDKNDKTVFDHARNFPPKVALKLIQTLKDQHAVDVAHNSKYFRYKNNTYTSHYRPNNQSTPEVQQKIATRIIRYVNEHNLETTILQKLFTEEVKKNARFNEGCQLKTNKIDIAHNIAGAKLTEIITVKMNSVPDTSDDEKFAEFADDLLSTDDESGKKEAKKAYHKLADPTIAPAKKLQKAKNLLEHMNRASRNLMPGHSSPNRALQENRDAHLMLDKNHQLVETPMSKKLSNSTNTLFGTPYNCRTRNKDGRIEIQSSSVHQDKDKSWIRL